MLHRVKEMMLTRNSYYQFNNLLQQMHVMAHFAYYAYAKNGPAKRTLIMTMSQWCLFVIRKTTQPLNQFSNTRHRYWKLFVRIGVAWISDTCHSEHDNLSDNSVSMNYILSSYFYTLNSSFVLLLLIINALLNIMIMEQFIYKKYILASNAQ